MTLISKSENIFKSIPLINLFELLSYRLSEFFQDIGIKTDIIAFTVYYWTEWHNVKTWTIETCSSGSKAAKGSSEPRIWDF